MENAVNLAIPMFALQRGHGASHAWLSLLSCPLLSFGFVLCCRQALCFHSNTAPESELNTDFCWIKSKHTEDTDYTTLCNPADNLPQAGEDCCSTQKLLQAVTHLDEHSKGAVHVFDTMGDASCSCCFIAVLARGEGSAASPVAVSVQIKSLTPGLSCHYFCPAPPLFSQLIQTIEMVKTYHCW